MKKLFLSMLACVCLILIGQADTNSVKRAADSGDSGTIAWDTQGDYSPKPSWSDTSFPQSLTFDCDQFNAAFIDAQLLSGEVYVSNGNSFELKPKTGYKVVKIEFYADGFSNYVNESATTSGSWEEANNTTTWTGEVTSSETLTISFKSGAYLDGLRVTYEPTGEAPAEPITGTLSWDSQEQTSPKWGDTPIPSSLTFDCDYFNAAFSEAGFQYNAAYVSNGKSFELKPKSGYKVVKVEFYADGFSQYVNDTAITPAGTWSEADNIAAWTGEVTYPEALTIPFKGEAYIDGLRVTYESTGETPVDPDPETGNAVFQGYKNPAGLGGTQFSASYDNTTMSFSNDIATIKCSSNPDNDDSWECIAFPTGSTITITPAEGKKLTSIVFNGLTTKTSWATYEYPIESAEVSSGSVTINGVVCTWTGVATSNRPLVITNTSSDRALLNFIKLTYDIDDLGDNYVFEPSFTYASGTYPQTQPLSIKTEDGYTLSYAVVEEGSTEQNWTEYTEPFTLTPGKYTVYAKASHNGNDSEIVSAEYTIIQDSNDLGWWTMPDGTILENNAEITIVYGQEPYETPTFTLNPKFNSIDYDPFYGIVSGESAEYTDDETGIIIKGIGTTKFRVWSYDENLAYTFLTVNVIPDPNMVVAPSATVKNGNATYTLKASEQFPVTPGMTLAFASEGADVTYTVNGGAAQSGDLVVEDSMVDTTLEIVATATKGDKSESTNFTIPVHNWVAVDGSNVTVAANSFFIVGYGKGAKVLTSTSVAVGNQYGLASANASTLNGGNVFKGGSDAYIFQKNNSTMLQPLGNTAEYLYAYSYTGYGFKIVDFSGSNSVISVNNGNLAIGGTDIKYNTATGNFNIAAGEAAQLYAWTNTPEEKTVFTLGNNTYDNIENVPADVDDTDELTVVLPAGYVGSYTLTSDGQSKTDSGYVVKFNEFEGKTVTVDFTATRDENDPKVEFSKEFNVAKTSFSFYVLSGEGDNMTETPAEEGYNGLTANLTVGDRLKVVPPTKAAKVNYGPYNTSAQPTVWTNDGEPLIITFRDSSETWYSFTARNSANVEIADINLLVNVTGNVSEGDFDFTDSAYGLKLSDDAANESLVGGTKNVSFSNGDYECFIPGGDNRVALVTFDGKQTLKIFDNSCIRLGLPAGRRFTEVTIYATNCDGLKFGRPNYDKPNYPGIFTEVGTATVNAGSGEVVWKFNPEDEQDVLTLEIWNAPAQGGVAALADAPAYIRSMYITTDQATGVQGIAIDGDDADWYNLNGERVNGERLQPGIYVRVQNGNAMKVMIR